MGGRCGWYRDVIRVLEDLVHPEARGRPKARTLEDHGPPSRGRANLGASTTRRACKVDHLRCSPRVAPPIACEPWVLLRLHGAWSACAQHRLRLASLHLRGIIIKISRCVVVRELSVRLLVTPTHWTVAAKRRDGSSLRATIQNTSDAKKS